ncbi:MAG: gluconate 2-dehydrogenase subunit 3 family protein [Saprospiraceae bacterium]|nr:gluconate 2-dehydrogenase subunit 3 family protein [Saprospiraceae bacterium]MCF8252775.1 gluconate 2-dehydrogenase subunit 3 family protein [Saprospiraceae bacterium]MCF8283166.1 gluconate 2-dehydrogenase subunit 3 family protein [Bacteroidales bacterium]MCF8314330.1 gluconate 2-dehydrogenase subunit 3 family protein [Saprospiraceae bacterium]MCF8443202.1 gluconate 2-dehydrogenase subunit 3 family protein [Saprospiraceae bacterium]
MKRRDSLKFIGVGSITAGLFLESCKPDKKEAAAAPDTSKTDDIITAGREAFEIERDKKLLGETFFTPDEMATIAVLADIIIPKDEVSGSATEAGVPEFIEFIVKDLPEHQTPMRGGLRWLDMECYGRFEKAFVDCSPEQRLQVVDDIAYPNKAKPEMGQGVAFFNRMRDLTATGFYTTEIGFADIGYKGNLPGTYVGVPAEVLEEFGVKELDWG